MDVSVCLSTLDGCGSLHNEESYSMYPGYPPGGVHNANKIGRYENFMKISAR